MRGRLLMVGRRHVEDLYVLTATGVPVLSTAAEDSLTDAAAASKAVEDD